MGKWRIRIMIERDVIVDADSETQADIQAALLEKEEREKGVYASAVAVVVGEEKS